MFIDEQDYIEHIGVKGMRWGVRRERRLQRAKRIAAGKGSIKDRAAFAAFDRKTYTKKDERKQATKVARKLAQRKERIKKGEAKTRDMLALYGGDRMMSGVALGTLFGPLSLIPKPKKIIKEQARAKALKR